MTRQQTLGAALVATLALTAWAAWQDDDGAAAPVEAVAPQRRATAAPAPRPAASTDTAEPPPRAPWPELADAARAAWGPPPPPPPPPAPVVAAAPSAPPVPKFPFRWIGRLVDGGRTLALLSGDERSFGVAAGEAVNEQWRLQRITDQRLEVTWLPTGDTVAVPQR